MKLYDLADEYRSFVAEVEAHDLEPQTLLDTLEGSTQLMSIEEKSGNIVKMIKNWESDTIGLETEIKRLTDRKKVIDNRVESVKNFLFNQLEYAGLTEVKTGIATIKQVNNPPAVNIVDENKVPAIYKTIIPQSYKTSKADIAKHLKDGIAVPGCELVHKKSWRIK